MRLQKHSGFIRPATVIFLVLLIALVVLSNRWLQQETKQIVSEPAASTPSSPSMQAVEKKRSKPVPGGELIRKTRLSPDRKHEIHVLYQGGVEIASYKTSNGEVYDQVGEIPDGKVSFFNKANETYGVEYYWNGKRHGTAEVYYSDGQLRQELAYQYGKLITNKEYYHDGTLRMTEDFSNARPVTDGSETGVGKVYTRHGTVKFEWFFVNSEPVGFKKSYDQKGRLVDAVYYDEFGHEIEPNTAPITSDIMPASPVSTVVDITEEPTAPALREKLPKQIFVPSG